MGGDGGGEAGAGVADDDVVGPHGLEGLYGLADGFAFGDGGVADVEVCDVCGEAFCGDFEGGVGAGGGLVEEGEDGFSFEGWDFFYGAGEEFFEGDGLIEEEVDFFACEGGDV